MHPSSRCHCLYLMVALASLVAVGCSELAPKLQAEPAMAPYTIDVVQGNVITREQVAALRSGMPRPIVRDILGTPLLTSAFHADRWDYVFTLKRQGVQAQTRKVSVFFKADALDRVEADDLPTEAEFAATLKSAPIKGPVPVLEATPASLSKYPPAAASAPSPAPAPADTPKTYPPLEPTGN